MTWASSESAWRLWKPASPSSNPGSAAPDTVAALLPEIAALEARAGAGKFEQALHREIARRMHRLADGVLAYRQHAVHRTLDNPPAVWSEGNTRLLDYGATHRAARKRGTRAVLVVPSLINRWEVLDLTAEKSLLRAMAAAGLRPYLVDWGTPNDEERRFDSTAYVARLERALGFIARRARRAPAVMGYCMGGTLTVALAARRPRRVAGLALLAAPWDFHADRTGHAFLVSAGPLLAEMADRVGELPVDILQTLFWSLDPWLAVKKFGRFLGMDQQGDVRPRLRAARGLAERRRAARRPDGARMPGRLVRRQPAGRRQVGGRRPAHRAVPHQRAGAGHDPVGRSHRAALVGGGTRRSQARLPRMSRDSTCRSAISAWW